MVVPCATSATAAPDRSAARSRSATASSTACSKLGGVEGTLRVQTCPASSIATTSVNVPPTSAPIRMAGREIVFTLCAFLKDTALTWNHRQQNVRRVRAAVQDRLVRD